MEKKHENAGSEELSIPMLPLAVLLAAVILSGAVFYSATQVNNNINDLKAAIMASNQNRPEATPTPSPGTGGSGGTGGTGGTGGAAAGGSQEYAERPFKGTDDAAVVILEYSEYECPFCSRVLPTLDQLHEEYAGQIKHIFINYPLPFHNNAQKASEAAECAADQGKFWEMHDMLFANPASLDVASIKGYAQAIGLNTETFNQCLDSGAKSALVSEHLSAGAAAGVSGTPTYIINGKMVVGAQPIEVFRTAIDAALAEAG